MDGLERFRRQLADFGERELPRRVQRHTQEAALAVLRGVVARTPVATGRARGNWQVSLDGPAAGLVEARDPDGSVTIRRGAEAIARVEPGGSLWISNNLPYIAGLEHGGADRAPAAMVRTTLAEVRARLGGG